LLVRAQGSDTLSLSPLRFRSDPPLTFHRPQSLQGLAATSALKGHEAFAQYDDYRGVPVIAVTRRLDRAPWGLVVKVDKAEALSNHRVWVRQVHTIVGLLWLMVGTVGVALGRVVRAADLRALAASERRLRRFYESGLLGVMYWDMRGHISDANDKFLEMIGYTREDLAGGQIDWVNLTPPEFRYLDDASVAELMATGVNERPLEKEYVRKDGSRLPILIASAMLDDARINGVAFVLDITRRRRAEQEVACLNKDLERRVIARTAELDAANRELEAFSYSVSHDLRAPLRAIDGFSRMLLEDHASSLNSEGRRLLGVVREQTMRMAQLIDDLLAFSRIDRRPLNRVVVDMTALAQSTFAELTTQAERECIAFAVHPMPPALGEPAMVRQLWANLLANAVKFTSGKPQRRIEVGASADGSGPVYWVKDNGAGFDMRYKDKLFGVFQRLHSSTEFPGTGVGLALVKRIVERHGGTVWAEGAPGEGASFFWTLPAQEETP
jgi:PAS domain S-box-containing protein